MWAGCHCQGVGLGDTHSPAGSEGSLPWLLPSPWASSLSDALLLSAPFLPPCSPSHLPYSANLQHTEKRKWYWASPNTYYIHLWDSPASLGSTHPWQLSHVCVGGKVCRTSAAEWLEEKGVSSFLSCLVQHIKEKLLEAPEPTDNSSWSQANQRTQSMGTRRTEQALCIPCQDPHLCQSWASNVPRCKPKPEKNARPGQHPTVQKRRPTWAPGANAHQ